MSFMAKIVSLLRKKGETVKALRIVSEDACSADMLVLIRWQGRTDSGAPIPTEGSERERMDHRSDWRLALLGGVRLLFLIYARLPKGHENSSRYVLTPAPWRRGVYQALNERNLRQKALKGLRNLGTSWNFTTYDHYGGWRTLCCDAFSWRRLFWLFC
jgi:hypothetical protein